MIYISLGSNLGDREAHLRFACREIKKQCSKICCSSLYNTAAQDDTDQPDYLNAVVGCETSLEPDTLLEALLLIEQKAGRTRDFQRRYGPRTLDLDILLFNDSVVKTERLCIPHPRFIKRAFVLVPLLELEPSLVHPLSGKPCKEYLENVKDQGVVKASGPIRIQD